RRTAGAAAVVSQAVGPSARSRIVMAGIHMQLDGDRVEHEREHVHEHGQGQGRFSPTEYSAKLRLAMPEADADGWGGEPDTDGVQAFAGLAEDIRNYVAAPLGMTAEQRSSYGERLNKAVL